MVGAKAELAAAKEKPRKRTQLGRALDAEAFVRLRGEQERNADLEEKLRAAEIKVEGLESEVEELKAERDRLRERVAELEAALNQRPSHENAIAGDFKIRTNRGGADYLDPGDIPVCLRRAKP
jgi:septal ring factor EnvC (AmiA/AmiB activator)